MPVYKRDSEIRIFLSNAQAARVKKLGYEERLVRLRSRAERMTAGLKETPGGHAHDSLERIWATYADMVSEYEAKVQEALDEMNKIDEFIDGLHISYIEREIIRLRYCNGLTWEQIQMLIRKAGYWYSQAYLWELHANALEAAKQEYDIQRGLEEDKAQLLERLRKQKEEEEQKDAEV